MADEIKISALPVITAASLTDVAPVVASGVTYQESNQKVLDLFKQQIAFQRNNDFTTIDLTSADAFLSNPAATTYLVTGQPNSSRSISLPVSNASNSWPRGTNSIYFINDGDYDVTIKYASGAGLATLKAGGVVQLALINNSTSNGVFTASQPLQAFNNLSDVENLATTQTNLQITGIQDRQISFYPAGTNGAIAGSTSYANGVNIKYLQFSDTGLHYAIAQIKMYKRWDQMAFNLIIPWYSPDASVNGSVVWYADATVVDSTFDTCVFGTAQSATSALPAALDNETDPAILNIVPGGFPLTDTPTLIIRIYRDGGTGGDDMVGNANLMDNVMLVWTADQGNDG